MKHYRLLHEEARTHVTTLHREAKQVRQLKLDTILRQYTAKILRKFANQLDKPFVEKVLTESRIYKETGELA